MRDVQLELPIRNRFIVSTFYFHCFYFIYDFDASRVSIKVGINYIHLLLHINTILFFRRYISYWCSLFSWFYVQARR